MSILLLLYLSIASIEALQTQCPVGFDVAHDDVDHEVVCYQTKGPEVFADKFENCAGNLFTQKKYNNMKLKHPGQRIWTDYKTLYGGGPFVDSAYLEYEPEPNYTLDYSADEELCLVMDPVTELTAVRCNETYERYCFVEAYPTDMNADGCEGTFPDDESEVRSFWSPTPTCVGVFELDSKIKWSQALDECVRVGGSLLNRGWIYSNYGTTIDTSYPLGISFNETGAWYMDVNNSYIPPSDRHFSKFDNEWIKIKTKSYPWVHGNGLWEVRFSDVFVYSQIMCERSLQLQRVNMTVYINSENECILKVNGDLSKDKISCFTDSYRKIQRLNKMVITSNTYLIEYVKDGYYWCTHSDTRYFYKAESEKVLHIKVKNETLKLYALKLNFTRDYIRDNIQSLIDGVWKKKLNEHVKVQNLVLKRSYRDGRSALLHLELMHPITTEGRRWNDIEDGVQVQYVRPVYYCEKNSTRLALGETSDPSECKIVECVGNFNEGVQLRTVTDKCPKPDLSDIGAAKVTERPTQLQLIQDIEKLVALANRTGPIKEEDIDYLLESISWILEDTVIVKINLLQLLDELGARIDLAGSTEFKIVKNNVALVVATPQPSAPVWGLQIKQRTSEYFTKKAFHLMTDLINSTDLESIMNEVVIQLPESVANSSRRISFVVFRNDRAFQSTQGEYTVNSRVLSINVENTTKFHDGEFIDLHLSPIIKYPKILKKKDRNSTCGYWHFLEDGSGYWSEEGCKFFRANSTRWLDTCSCNHLTHFAELLVRSTGFTERNENILEIISIIGCSVSIIGLTLVGITALLFRSWRRDFSNKIWLHLCISIFILSLTFLITIFAHFDEHSVLCVLTGIVLHFFVLSSFCWMLVAAVLSYRRLVTVYSQDPTHKLLRASAFAWGAPCAVVGILLSVAPHSYAGRFADKTPTAAFCYPSGLALWLAVFAPIALMLLANWTLFALILRSVFASRTIHRHGDSNNEALRCAYISFFLVFLFGLPWVFGLFASNEVMSYCFVIFSTFQGFVLFLFIIVGNKNSRGLWLGYMKSKQTRQVYVKPSTISDKSTGGDEVFGGKRTELIKLRSKPKLPK